MVNVVVVTVLPKTWLRTMVCFVTVSCWLRRETKMGQEIGGEIAVFISLSETYPRDYVLLRNEFFNQAMGRFEKLDSTVLLLLFFM